MKLHRSPGKASTRAFFLFKVPISHRIMGKRFPDGGLLSSGGIYGISGISMDIPVASSLWDEPTGAALRVRATRSRLHTLTTAATE